MKIKTTYLRTQISTLIWFFMISLIFSGITAMAVRSGILTLLDIVPSSWTNIYAFLVAVQAELFQSNNILFYGYDWLAFSNIVICILFIGVLKDPIRNIWVVKFGMIVCILIIPFALSMGEVRGIPIWWRIVDCSFGVFGFLLLWLVRVRIITLQKVIDAERLNTVF